ncbi:MAG TPA: glycosyltransferase family 2 protein [Gaiellaceae bacterium]
MTVDVVVVAYRSAAHLRECVEPLCDQPGLNVIVVDNACPERSPALVADLDLEIVEMGANEGFSAGCNAGAGRGRGEAILFLNPDARIEPAAVRALAERLEHDPRCGACGPRVLDGDGHTSFTMRNDPRLGSAFAEALFVHHLLPHARRANEIVRDGYDEPAEVEWLSGAALCVRRTAFDRLGGFDRRFFMYSEDADLCLRLRNAGLTVRYDPAVVARHEGGASAPSPGQAALKASSRLLYARIHAGPLERPAFRVAAAVYEVVRLPLALARSRAHLRGRLAALGAVLGRAPRRPA